MTTVPRFDDVDALGIVNNARFMTYAEEGRVAFLRAYDLAGRGWVVARTEIDYRRPILLDSGPVTVGVSVTSVGRASATLRQTLSQAGELAADVVVVLVGYDATHRRPRRFDEDERAALLAHGPAPAPTPAPSQRQPREADGARPGGSGASGSTTQDAAQA
ncbi:MAG: acyl-CoA thioesterase [Frankia sp.]